MGKTKTKKRSKPSPSPSPVSQSTQSKSKSPSLSKSPSDSISSGGSKRALACDSQEVEVTVNGLPSGISENQLKKILDGLKLRIISIIMGKNGTATLVFPFFRYAYEAQVALNGHKLGGNKIFAELHAQKVLPNSAPTPAYPPFPPYPGSYGGVPSYPLPPPPQSLGPNSHPLAQLMRWAKWHHVDVMQARLSSSGKECSAIRSLDPTAIDLEKTTKPKIFVAFEVDPPSRKRSRSHSRHSRSYSRSRSKTRSRSHRRSRTPPRRRIRRGSSRGRNNEICRDNQRGKCQFGSSCKFIHDTETPNKRQTCRDWQRGHCSYGKDCRYLHED